MATLSTTPPLNPSSTLQPDLIQNIDMTTLTQSQLYTLSLLSSSSFDLRCTHDLVIPTIDRSLFNESAGSRRQTFSRPSPTHSHHHHHRHRLAGLLPSSSSSHHHHHHHNPSTTTTDNNPNTDRLENQSIINFLKTLLSQNPNFSDIEFTPTPIPQPSSSSFFSHSAAGNLGTIPEIVVRKRKRGRKPKVKPGFEEEREMGLEIVNKNGVAVDVLGLVNLDDPYGEELKRRTEGMGSEEELLAFLTDLGGQWCSRRRKRKIVDGCVLGDVLPVGWKLLLGLKRREGRASVYVRRYIRWCFIFDGMLIYAYLLYIYITGKSDFT